MARYRWNPRMEAFAIAYAAGNSGAEAARQAGYRGGRYQARELLKRDDVKVRIAEIQAETAKRNEFTVDKLMEQLKEDREAAREAGQHSAAVKASELQGKLSGHLVDRVDARVQMDTRTDEQIEASIAAKMRQLGLAAKVIEHDG